jgi:acyl-CoA thioester hydrolase
MITCETCVRVRYSETDQMGIVHHSQFLNWLECARIELLDQIEMPYSQLEATGCSLPVLSVQVQYHRPAKFDDRISTRVILKELPRARMELHYEIRRLDTVLSTAITRHAFTGTNGQVIRPPKRFMIALRQHWLTDPHSSDV